jgi:hypothetical protein
MSPEKVVTLLLGSICIFEIGWNLMVLNWFGLRPLRDGQI